MLPPGRRPAARSARPCRLGPASMIASATLSGVETIQRVCGLVDELLLREALGGDEAGEDHADVNAVLTLFEMECVGPARQGRTSMPSRRPSSRARRVLRSRRRSRSSLAPSGEGWGGGPRSGGRPIRSSASCGARGSPSPSRRTCRAMPRPRCSPGGRAGRARPRPSRRPSPARRRPSGRRRSTVAPPISAASASRRSCRRATRMSFAPGSRAIRLAAASPMPLEAPVTSAITARKLSEPVLNSEASGA